MSGLSSSSPSQSEQIIRLQNELAWAKMKILSLEEQLRLQRIKKYGPGSEKLDSAQLELLELEPGVSRLEVRAESQREPLPAARAKSRKHPGRQGLPAELPRVERVIACTPEQRTCKACGQETAVIGYETSEQLDVEPAKYFVVVTKREKRACKCCQEGGVTAAAAPARIVEKGLASDRVVIDTVVAKYSDHLPLYRQSAMLDREAGVEISRATLDGWVMRVGELLIPIVSVMRRELLGGSYLQADETTVDVQMHDGSGHNHQFFEAAKLDPGDVVAVRMVAWIDELFGIDAEARERKLDHAGRHALRLERATPWLATIGEEIETVRTSALPSSALGRAAKYTFSLWRKLTRFLEYPELELSNNLAENSMRPVALGRKNWIHVGSKDAGPKVAAIASIVETCRRLKIPIRGYLTGVMPGIADVPIQRLADLTPAAWAARQQ